MWRRFPGVQFTENKEESNREALKSIVNEFRAFLLTKALRQLLGVVLHLEKNIPDQKHRVY